MPPAPVPVTPPPAPVAAPEPVPEPVTAVAEETPPEPVRGPRRGAAVRAGAEHAARRGRHDPHAQVGGQAAGTRQ